MLKYITLNQLMASVESDLSTFADSGMIDRGKVIKVVRRVSADIGLKINQDRSAIIELKNGKALIPEDLLFLQSACVCLQSQVHVAAGESMGTNTEESVCVDINLYTCETTRRSCIRQIFRDKTITYSNLSPVKVVKTQMIASHCPNLNTNSNLVVSVTPEGEIIGNFDGKLYITYLADLVDNDNNILVLDHPLVRDYYEYAVKKHLLEMWLLNNDADVAEKWKMIKAELYESRLRALNFIDTIEYSHIQRTYEANRERFYRKYVSIFE